MYKKTDKRRLYWLIDKYLHNDINEKTFCDEFYYCYDLELDKETLTELEKQKFFELNQITSRFSPYEKDHSLDDHAFSTVNELKNKIQETNDTLGG